MSTTAPSKFAENQVLSATVNGFPLMSELLADTTARATTATNGIAAFGPVMGTLSGVAGMWNAGETVIANAEAALPGSTLAFDDKMASLTRKPDADTPSILENWDITIRSQVAYQGPTYLLLLPHGRETLTNGTREEQLDAIRDLGIRLAAQAAKPVLVTLGATVTTFGNAARALRTTQTNAKSTLENARLAQEPLRVAAANAIYALIGQGMVTWNATPARVDTLWDVNILRNAPQQVPAAPTDTIWDPATRTLSTTALPTGATRLEAWRVGPGSMPELLLTAGPGATAIIIPATITFTPGDLYQLWLVAINSKAGAPPVRCRTGRRCEPTHPVRRPPRRRTGRLPLHPGKFQRPAGRSSGLPEISRIQKVRSAASHVSDPRTKRYHRRIQKLMKPGIHSHPADSQPARSADFIFRLKSTSHVSILL